MKFPASWRINGVVVINLLKVVMNGSLITDYAFERKLPFISYCKRLFDVAMATPPPPPDAPAD